MMGAGGEEGGGSAQWMNIVFLVGIFVVFYFFMIRPQQRKAKQQKEFRESLSKGDKVVTIGGVHGKIVEVEETTLILEMVDNSKIRVEKSAVSADTTMNAANKK